MAVEHLHLHLRRTHWETKSHPNLGVNLQDALDELDKEGWEVVSVFCIDRSPEIIMKREKKAADHFSLATAPPPTLQAQGCDLLQEISSIWLIDEVGLSLINLAVRSWGDLKKPNLYDLLRLRAEARGTFVDALESADTVFSVAEGVPYRLEEIAAEFMEHHRTRISDIR